MQYEADSAPAMAIQKTIEQTKRRFDMYGKQGLYCGEDGLPHLVTSGDWNHAGEFMVSLANVPQIGGRSIADPYHGRAADDNFAPVYQPFTTTLSPFCGTHDFTSPAS